MKAFTDFMTANPEYGYFFAAAAFLLVIIGLILDWDWVVEPGGGYFNIADFIEMFGRKTVRIVFGFTLTIAFVLLLHSFFTYNPDLYLE